MQCYIRQHFADRHWLHEHPGGHVSEREPTIRKFTKESTTYFVKGLVCRWNVQKMRSESSQCVRKTIFWRVTLKSMHRKFGRETRWILRCRLRSSCGWTRQLVLLLAADEGSDECSTAAHRHSVSLGADDGHRGQDLAWKEADQRDAHWHSHEHVDAATMLCVMFGLGLKFQSGESKLTLQAWARNSKYSEKFESDVFSLWKRVMYTFETHHDLWDVRSNLPKNQPRTS